MEPRDDSGSDCRGNIIQPYIEVELNFRTSPSTDPEEALPLMKELIEKNPPYGAIVTLEADFLLPGFNVDPFPSWYENAGHEASLHTYGDRMLKSGEGGRDHSFCEHYPKYAGQ